LEKAAFLLLAAMACGNAKEQTSGSTTGAQQQVFEGHGIYTLIP
jgi:hypothetical protein